MDETHFSTTRATCEDTNFGKKGKMAAGRSRPKAAERADNHSIGTTKRGLYLFRHLVNFHSVVWLTFTPSFGQSERGDSPGLPSRSTATAGLRARPRPWTPPQRPTPRIEANHSVPLTFFTLLCHCSQISIVHNCHHCHKYKYLPFVICEHLWHLPFVNKHSFAPSRLPQDDLQRPVQRPGDGVARIARLAQPCRIERILARLRHLRQLPRRRLHRRAHRDRPAPATYASVADSRATSFAPAFCTSVTSTTVSPSVGAG